MATIKHALQTAAWQLEGLTIDCFHVSNPNPHISLSLGFFITSTDKLSYGFMYKYERAKDKQLCDAMVASIEQLLVLMNRVESNQMSCAILSCQQQPMLKNFEDTCIMNL